MGKHLILAVAGSGKTTTLISKLNLEQRFLLVTYTTNNLNHLRNSVIRKFGYFPENIKVCSYFQFLYSFCFKPYCGLTSGARGITFKRPADHTRFKPGTDVFYMTSERLMYSNRIAHYCEQNCADEIRERLDKYYDWFMVDEVQDIAGRDFNLLMKIIPENCNSLFVGDFYQHTYDTSNDGNVNQSLYNDLNGYLGRWRTAGVEIDHTTLSKTHRCSEEICEFVVKTGILIGSYGTAKGKVIEVSNEEMADSIISNNDIPKLFYAGSSGYDCISMNWGESKGIDYFKDVCVVLNKTTMAHYLGNTLIELSPQTRNKFYVACTRAHNNLYLMDVRYLEKWRNNS